VIATGFRQIPGVPGNLFGKGADQRLARGVGSMPSHAKGVVFIFLQLWARSAGVSHSSFQPGGAFAGGRPRAVAISADYKDHGPAGRQGGRAL